MKREQVNQILFEIQRQNLVSPEDLQNFLNSNPILKTKEDKIQVLKKLIRNEPSRFMLCNTQILDCVTKNKSFLDLIIKMVDENVLDASWYVITDIYKNDPDVAEYLYENLKKKNDIRYANVMGYLLRGFGDTKPVKLFQFIISNKNPTIIEQIAYLLSLYFQSHKPKFPRKIVNFIMKSSESSDPIVQRIAIWTMTLSLISLRKVQKRLVQLAKTNDTVQSYIASELVKISKSNTQDVFKIAESLSKAANINTIGHILLAIGSHGTVYPIECLKLIKFWLRKRDISHKVQYQWVLEKIGHGKLDEIEKFLLDWINSERNYVMLTLIIPDILPEIYKHNKPRLLELLKKINRKSRNKLKLILNTLQSILSDALTKPAKTEKQDLQNQTEVLVKDTYSFLCQIALEKKVNIKSSQGADLLSQALILLDNLRHGKIKVHFSRAQRNLKYFDKLVTFLRKEKLIELIKKKNAEHPLIIFLSRILSEPEINKLDQKINNESNERKKIHIERTIRDSIYPLALLTELNNALAMFSPNEPGTKSIRKGLLDGNQFYQTWAEISIAARLKKKYHVVLQPQIGTNNKADVKVSINNQDLIIEVHTPNMHFKLKHAKGAIQMDNKIGKSILAKVNNQLKFASGTNVPVLIAIDRTHAIDVDEIDVTDALFGSVQLGVMVNEEKKTKIKPHWSRARNSISDQSPFGKIVSGILFLQSYMDISDKRIKWNGKLIPNPQAAVPLNKKIAQNLKETILINAI